MESIRDIQVRLKSIEGTKQITQSMRLISTRKVQKAKLRMEDNRPFLSESVNMAMSMAKNPQFARSEYVAGRDETKTLIILITGDRGLCGGYNVNVEKEAYTLMKKHADSQIIIIGAKGRDYFRRRKKPIAHFFKGLSENPFYDDAQSIGSIAVKMFDEKTVDRVFLVYTEYKSMLALMPKCIRLLPLEANDTDTKPGLAMNYESGGEALFKFTVSSYVSSVLFGAMLESGVSEQCARIIGMDSAVKNSNKIIDSLALQYNQMRQGAITQEIAEIVGGANTVTRR